MEVTKATRMVPSPLTAVEYRLQLNLGGLTWEPVMSTGMRATMAMMRLRMKRQKHRKPMKDQHKIWRTKGIVLQSVKIGQYMSDLYDMIMAKPVQWQAMYPKQRLYRNK